MDSFEDNFVDDFMDSFHGQFCSKIRQSTIYYAGLLGRWDKGIVAQESDVPSIISYILFIDTQNSLFLFLYFYKKIGK